MPTGVAKPIEILHVAEFESPFLESAATTSTCAAKLVQTRRAPSNFVPCSLISIVLPGATACGVTCDNVGCATASCGTAPSQPAANRSAAATCSAERRLIDENLSAGSNQAGPRRA